MGVVVKIMEAVKMLVAVEMAVVSLLYWLGLQKVSFVLELKLGCSAH